MTIEPRTNDIITSEITTTSTSEKATIASIFQEVVSKIKEANS